MTADYAAIMLAGGGGRRLGGRDKPALPVGGRSMLRRVLDAVIDASPRIVVGPARPELGADVVQVREQPPGGGPVAALAAGLAAFGADAGDDPAFVAVLAADLPFLRSADIEALRRSVTTGDHDGAVLLDEDGRQQWLCGMWRTAALRGRLAELDPPAGQSMRTLMAGLRRHGVDRREIDRPPPWYDCDTEDDYRRAEEWA